MEDNLLGLMWGTDWFNRELQFYCDEESLLVTDAIRVAWKGDLVAIDDSVIVLGEG